VPSIAILAFLLTINGTDGVVHGRVVDSQLRSEYVFSRALTPGSLSLLKT